MNNKNILCVCILIALAIGQKSYSQNQHRIDSLMNVLKFSIEDTNKAKILNALSYNLWNRSEFDLAKKYADNALQLSKKLEFKKGEANAYNNLGIIYDYQGKYQEALKNHFASLKIKQVIGNKEGVAMSYNNIGLIYMYQGNYVEALQEFFASLKISEELGSKYGVALMNLNIGNIYYKQGNFQDGLKYYLTSLKIREEIGDTKGIAGSHSGIALIYQGQGNYIEARKNYLIAIEIEKEIEDKDGLAIDYFNLASLNSEMKNYQEALKYYLAATEIFEHIGDKSSLAGTYVFLGSVYVNLRRYSEADKYLHDALKLSMEIGSKDDIKNSYMELSKMDSAIGNYRQSLEHYKLYTIYKDSMFNETSSRQTAELKTQYDSEKKEKEIVVLTKDKEIQNVEIKKQKLLKNSLIGSVGLILALAFLGYRTYRTRQLLKLQTLRNRIASDLHDDVGSTLSSISIFSEMAKEQNNEVSPMLEQIGESSRRMLDAMADIVWTINSENDQFEQIILRMKSFAFELLGAKKMDFEFDADESIFKIKLPMDVRKNLYLIFKEATNNMVKYADANKASFSISGNKEKLTMFIRDNGRGFDVKKDSPGNGLKNMKKRAQEMGANLLIESEAGMGTTLQIILNLA